MDKKSPTNVHNTVIYRFILKYLLYPSNVKGLLNKAKEVMRCCSTQVSEQAGVQRIVASTLTRRQVMKVLQTHSTV